MNILLTSAGRRTSLLSAFQEVAHSLGRKVFVAEMDPLAPTCALADGAFRVPRVTDPIYITSLLDLAKAQGVGLIIPTIDSELAAFAEHMDIFQANGIHLLISTLAFVETCGDKWKTFLAFQREKVAVPASWLPENLPDSLPENLFLKPRDGSASAHTYHCSHNDLSRMLPLVPNAIIQECLSGLEVTIDAFLDFQGHPIHFVPRERIRTVGGESIQGVTLDLPEMDAWLSSLLDVCGSLGARGPITLQAFRTEKGNVLTEINPRFGGGFPLARAAGGDYPNWIMSLLGGKRLEPKLGQYRHGLYMTRSYTETFLESLPWPR